MLIKSTEYKDIVKYVRQKIINFSGIDANRVFNATSVRGPDLSKIISETETSSFETLMDTFIVFELLEDEGAFYSATREDESTMSSIVSYNFNLKIYGTSSHDVARYILSGFKISEQLIDLRERYGIYVTGVSPISSINEIINETVWMRCDLTIKLQTRFEMKMDELPKSISTEFTIKTF